VANAGTTAVATVAISAGMIVVATAEAAVAVDLTVAVAAVAIVRAAKVAAAEEDKLPDSSCAHFLMDMAF
jgi:hypothetical protein